MTHLRLFHDEDVQDFAIFVLNFSFDIVAKFDIPVAFSLFLWIESILHQHIARSSHRDIGSIAVQPGRCQRMSGPKGDWSRPRPQISHWGRWKFESRLVRS